MSQGEGVGPVEESVGYVLKQAATALRGAMDTVLHPHGLTVSQYATLEVLGQRPGLSGSDLARATFVTRQSMNLVLRGLQERGLLTRAAVASQGKALPTTLTDDGRVRLRAASAAVRDVERQMLAPLAAGRQHQLRADLSSCVYALTTRGLGQLDEPVVPSADPASGFPVVTLDRRVTAADVARALDDE